MAFLTVLPSYRRGGHNTFKDKADILARIGDDPVNRLDVHLSDKWQPVGCAAPPRRAHQTGSRKALW